MYKITLRVPFSGKWLVALPKVLAFTTVRPLISNADGTEKRYLHFVYNMTKKIENSRQVVHREKKT